MSFFCRRARLSVFVVCVASALTAAAVNGSEVQGTVADPSGAVIAHANVDLVQAGKAVSSTRTDGQGRYRVAAPSAGRYELRFTAPGFRTLLSDSFDLAAGATREANVTLRLQTLSQQVTVTATGIPTTQAQLGAAVTVLTQKDYPQAAAIQDPLRLIPGLQVTQTGQPGGLTSLFIRGGNSDANKVLIDGIPMNDIGGAVEFANIAAAGIAKAEVLRGPNSALYGPDAMAGVVSLTTERGTTPLPEVTYRADGGNFGTYSQQGTLGGVYRRFDYFSDYAVLQTANSIPLDQFHIGTLATSFGWNLNASTSLRATLRHDRVAAGSPNAIELYAIPDQSKQQNEDAYIGLSLDSQTSLRWHNLVRYGGIRLRSDFTTFAPAGIPQYDGSGNLLDYLGAPVVIHGANGDTVSGQAVFNYPGIYPNQYPESTDRDFVYAQSDYRFRPHLVGLAAFGYENERGYAGGPSESVTRGNYNYTSQFQGDWKGRLFYTLGAGVEKDDLFGVVGTPRASLAFDLFRPRSSGLLDGTKLRASFGQGVKEPNLSDQISSLYALLSGLPNGSQLVSQYRVNRIGAERSRSYDGGVDQELFSGRGRMGVTYFHNEFTSGIEYIPQQGLIDLGVPVPVANAAVFGATVNSQAYRAQGIETEAEYRVGSEWFLRGGYTYLNAVIQHSFSSDAIGPSFNPNFPNIPIGVYTPLIGARPFRRAPNTGYFGVGYNHSRWSGLLTGTLVGSRDDSDFLAADANGGSTLLLPNRNLDGAYQRLDLSGSYRVNRTIDLYTAVQNLLSEHFSEVFGYQDLPFTFRSGIQITLGGESWKLK